MKFLSKRKVDACYRVLCCVVLFSAGVSLADTSLKDAAAGSKENSSASGAVTNDPNDQWWKKWDAVVKNPDDPNELVEAKLNAIIKVLQSQEPKPELKEKIIDKIISPFFDFELMSKLVLGRTHWPKFKSDEQKRFTELFTERLKKSYLEKITLYKDERIQLAPAVAQKTGIHIAMDILSNDTKIVILYKLRKADGQWKIYDVEVQGVSILLTYRSQFDDILRRGSVKEIFTALEQSATP